MTKKRQEQLERLEQATREVATSDGFRRWIETRAKFHRYSIRNQILIAMQCPDATRVAGFRRWQELGRQVRKGEKGIYILAPITVKDEDPATGEETKRLWFKAVAVFDIAQTDGEPLPEPPLRKLDGDPEQLVELRTQLHALAEELGCPVAYEDLDDRAGSGYYVPSEHRIVVDATLSAPDAVRTLTHELSHALGVGYEEFGRARAEVIVEAATTVALGSLGFDTSGESLAYIAVWGEGDDLAALQQDLERIDEVATRIEQACGLNGEEE